MAKFDYTSLPESIDAGLWKAGHIQGIAVDTANKYIYYAFTTVLVKARLDGTVVGTVTGIAGHLGCMDFCDADGKLYASLELKHDSIGQGIAKQTGTDIAEEDSFYIAIFDVDKITKPDMNAETDGVMTAIYLPRVVEYYNAVLPDGRQHKYGCSGIDGLSFGPVFGQKDGSYMLMIACGIYSDLDRDDNDCNLIMQYNPQDFGGVAKPLTQQKPHHSGLLPEHEYFLFTGNTNWGIQNLEYDRFTGDWLVSVYTGKKPQYPNFPMFVIDGSAAPYEDYIAYGEKGLHLTLKKEGVCDPATGIWGNRFPKGQTGIHAFGNGYYYISHEYKTPEKLQGSIIKLYKRSENPEIPLELV